MTTTFVYAASELREMLTPAKTYPVGKITYGLRLAGKERWQVANRAKAMRACGIRPNIKEIVMDYFG